MRQDLQGAGECVGDRDLAKRLDPQADQRRVGGTNNEEAIVKKFKAHRQGVKAGPRRHAVEGQGKHRHPGMAIADHRQ